MKYYFSLEGVEETREKGEKTFYSQQNLQEIHVSRSFSVADSFGMFAIHPICPRKREQPQLATIKGNISTDEDRRWVVGPISAYIVSDSVRSKSGLIPVLYLQVVMK